jgi:CubicO group peptidase (beta-lactamase class C family)
VIEREYLTMVMKRLFVPRLLLMIGCASLPINGQAAEPSPEAIAAKVDALFGEWAKPDSPGCAVAVVRGGRILYAKGYGMADLEHDVAITPRTVFYIGSISKQFTAYAVVKLAQQGRLALDDEVRKHLPELHDFGRPITIRHLIHHTSGLRDYFELLSLAGTREGDLVTQKDLLRIIGKQRELNFQPGERHLYSNSNYALLATIVERVTGESFRDWMARNVFAPLGMNQTQVCDDHQRIIKDRAWSYRSDPGAKGAFKTVVLPYSGYGAGGIYSTAEDLARWVSNYAKPRAGDDRAIRQMLEPGRLNSGQPINYAFALMVDQYRGLKRIGHTGSLAGYRAYLGFFPDQDFGVIVLGNVASFAPGKAMQLAELFLAEQVQEVKTAMPGPAAKPALEAGKTAPARREVTSGQNAEKPLALSEDELLGYAGPFASAELETTYTIVVEPHNLVVKHPRKEDVRLVARGKDQFAGNGSFLRVQFQRDSQGRISGLRVSNDRIIGLLFQRQP